MNPRIKALWLEELRSDRHIQGRGRLRDEQEGVVKECCLGVLCAIAEKEGVCTREGDRFDGYIGVLPPSVQTWSRLSENPRVDRWGLASHNDDGKSFHEIADLIEEHL